jgi:hypothetical protein
MENILLTPVPLPTLIEQIRAVVRAEITAEKNKSEVEKLLSPAETCLLFSPKISKVTLAKWTADGRLKRYDIGGRVYYRQGEVLSAAKEFKKFKK